MTDYECRPKFQPGHINKFVKRSLKSQASCIINDLSNLEIYDTWLSASNVCVLHPSTSWFLVIQHHGWLCCGIDINTDIRVDTIRMEIQVLNNAMLTRTWSDISRADQIFNHSTGINNSAICVCCSWTRNIRGARGKVHKNASGYVWPTWRSRMFRLL